MKRALIIGHFWPYHRGGSKRMLGLAKFLMEFGWEPVIISGRLQTVPERPFRVIETESGNRIASLKRFLRFDPKRGVQEQVGVPQQLRESHTSWTTKIVKTVEAAVTFPDVEIAWKSFALRAARDILRSERVDGIISVWPIVSHLVARELKKEFNTPWIADFPDMWAYTYAYRYGRIRQFLDKHLELKTLRTADELVTSSWPQSRFLEKLHGRPHVHTVTIGFDPERDNVPPEPLTKKFTITYTGVLYGQERHPGKFLQALSELIREGVVNPQDLEIRFYGKPDGWVEEQVRKLGLDGIVMQHGSIPWEECLKRQRDSQLLLQLNWENPEERGAYSGKIAEYLAARRPILCVGGFGNDVMEELMRDTSVGAYCPNVSAVKVALRHYYNEFKRSGAVSYEAQLEAVAKYSYREMAARFAGLLDGLAKDQG